MPAGFLALAFLYIIFIIEPNLYFHHVQPPFLLTTDFIYPYLTYPGGPSELIAGLIMQSFHYRFIGPFVFFGVVFVMMWPTFKLMNILHHSMLNKIWAFIPLIFAVTLTNNYNFPFSVIVSVDIVLLWLLLFAYSRRNMVSMLTCFTAGAAIIYYLSGSGYMLLFSVSALFIAFQPGVWKNLVFLVYILAFSILFPFVAAGYIFTIPAYHRYLYLFPSKPYFLAYEPSIILYFLLLSFPVLLGLARILAQLQKRKGEQGKNGMFRALTASAFVVVVFLAVFSHRATYRSDGKRIVASDYYCYHNNVRKTSRAATGLKKYYFAANLNYNLAIAKAGTLSEDIFDFLQISGTDALHPDVEFSTELAFVSADFYYLLGFISEARHWAYESLVLYPHSPRALQLLVKIHLVTGEYRAAGRCLNILKKGVINRSFVKEYAPVVKDTALVSSCGEIMEKRSLIPQGKELSPYIHERFLELLEANEKNKLAYECLMLYYLMDSQLEKFMELYGQAGKYFKEPVPVYEEAILMYGELNDIPVRSEYHISPATISRYEEFIRTLRQYEGNDRMARNVLYWEMGQSYLYYLHFIYPRIIKPEIIGEEYEEPPI